MKGRVRGHVARLVFSTLALMVGACGAQDERASTAASAPIVEPWPEAEALFRKDPRWLGGDAVSSIDLGGERVLWLFGDSFVGSGAVRARRGSTMVRNSIAVQRGLDVASASMAFCWNDASSPPSAFFAAPTESMWFWPGHGVRLGDRGVVFLWELKSVPEGLGFAALGWTAVVIENPDEEPARWELRRLETPNRVRALLGAAVVVDDGWLYAFGGGLERPEPTVLARWPLEQVERGSLAAPQWRDERLGFTDEASLAGAPAPVAEFGQSEFTVFRHGRGWRVVHTVGFGSSPLVLRTAPALAGPWSEPQPLWRPPELARPEVLVYSAKAHPMLRCDGFDLVASYSTNCLDFATLLDDDELYFPRFVRAKH